MRVVQIKYTIDNYQPTIHIYGRTSDGERKHVKIFDFEPYFYVHQQDREPFDPRIKRIEKTDIKNWMNYPLKKVITRIPANVREIRSFFTRYYESDIPFVMRFKYDTGLKSGMKYVSDVISWKDIEPMTPDIDPLVWHIDIETDDSEGFADAKYPTAEILSITVTIPSENKTHIFIAKQLNEVLVKQMLESSEFLNKNTKSRTPIPIVNNELIFHITNNEETLIAAFKDFYEKNTPDIITGWNVYNFDIGYLKRRSEVKKYKQLKFDKSEVFDLWIAFKALWKSTHGEIEDNRLETVGYELLGYGKIGRGLVSDLYKNDPEKFIVYNIWDTILTVRIDENMKIIKTFQQLADYTGILISKTLIDKGFNSAAIVDAMVLFESTGKIVLPNKIEVQEIEKEKGGFVHRPYNGRVKYVGVLDHGQEYPSIIRLLNMSFDTKVSKDFTGDCYVSLVGTKYRKDKRGIIPMILDGLSEHRKEVKKEMKQYPKGSQEWERLNMVQFSEKIIMNSFYGIMNAKKGQSRIYDFDIAYDILSIARDHLDYTKQFIEQNGGKVIYMDTDSVLFHKDSFENSKDVYDFAIWAAEKLNKLYETEYIKKFNAAKNYLTVKLDKIYEVFFQYRWKDKDGKEKGKKRYAVKTVYDGKWLDKSVVEFTGFDLKRSDTPELAKELQCKVLTMILEFKDIKEIREVIKSYYPKILQEKNKIGIPAKMGNLSQYKVKGAHIRAAEWSNEYLGTNISEGDRFLWIYGYVPGKPNTDVIAFELGQEIPAEVVIDEKQMTERIIRKKLEKIVWGLGYEWSGFLEGKKQLRLW